MQFQYQFIKWLKLIWIKKKTELPRKQYGRLVPAVRGGLPRRPERPLGLPVLLVPIGRAQPRRIVPSSDCRPSPDGVYVPARLPRPALRSLRLRFLWQRRARRLPAVPLRSRWQRQRRVRRDQRPVQLQARHYRTRLHLLRSAACHQSLRMLLWVSHLIFTWKKKKSQFLSTFWVFNVKIYRLGRNFGCFRSKLKFFRSRLVKFLVLQEKVVQFLWVVLLFY